MANQEKQLTLRDRIESKAFREAVAQVLPAHLTPERFVRLAIAAGTRTPKLNECDPTTVLQCLMQLSQFGLEPDGRNAHLIPFKNNRGSYDCTLILDYKGLATLAKRSGVVSYIHADKVCDNDIFEYNKGVVVKHEINFKTDRGKPYAYYAMVRFKDGTEQATCMTKSEVEQIRKRSRAASNGPWVTDFDQMALKTTFRRLSKWLELSPEFRDALEADSDSLEELRFENALPIKRAQIAGKKRLLEDSEPEAHDGAENGSGGEADPTAGIAESTQPEEKPTAAPKPAKDKKKLEGLVQAPENLTGGPNETKMLMRLEALKSSKDALVAVARQFEVIDEGQDWGAIGEDKFDVMLREANWTLVEEALKQ